MMPTDIEILTQLAQDNARKLDKLIYDLPERFVEEKRHQEIERRVDVLESQVGKINDMIANLHNTSMAFVNDAIREIVRQLTEESKSMRQDINELRVSIYRTIVMSVVLPVVVAVIIGVITHFAWH
jgi:uncharacterized coiled-coil protein SlyX